MHSIIIKHTSEFNQSKLGQRLDETLMTCLRATVTVNDETGTKLATLLEISNLPREVVMILTQPWYKANMIASWIEKHNLPTAKECAKDIIKKLKDLKKILTANSTEPSLFLMLLLTSSELDLDKILFNLNEIQSFFEFFIKHNFKNGNNYSANFFRRYAINSLFWMGKKMGLVETGKPTKLNQYLHIVTDRVYEDINKDFMRFKKIDFLTISKEKMNVPLSFIFNPFNEKTNNILSIINNRFTTT
ncbi:Uncharacterised protein [Legionella steigerwaltii]|uniref:Uncharacterized protein n=1 Tax=Legionella steigerwaltii TaxID=460 RepID=A0A378LCR2_9GAMM|nr:hypothetical protein [Legionella steigerwaltii]KTD79522.1 hypothetical protein Lstg_0738 [Legionella steigerwaltii]STY24593.1 Uncharacterised protein [Legionella steigerwaltii]